MKLGGVSETTNLYSVMIGMQMMSDTDYMFEGIALGGNEINAGVRTGIIMTGTVDTEFYKECYPENTDNRANDLATTHTICGPLELFCSHEPIVRETIEPYMNQVVSFAIFPDYSGVYSEDLLNLELYITHSNKNEDEFFVRFGWMSVVDSDRDGVVRRYHFCSEDKYNVGIMKKSGNKIHLMFNLYEMTLENGIRVIKPDFYDSSNGQDELDTLNDDFIYYLEGQQHEFVYIAQDTDGQVVLVTKEDAENE